MDLDSSDGCEVFRLRFQTLDVAVLPGKGGDLLQIVDRSRAMRLLWTSPWRRLRQSGPWSAATDSEGRLMEAYPGWQSVFPTGGDASPSQGTVWGMHGETWLAPFAWEPTGESSITLRAALVDSPSLTATDGAPRAQPVPPAWATSR